MSKPIYCFDASSFINLIKDYPRDVSLFTKVWAKFDQLVSEGRLISHHEVYKEIRDAELDEWKKKHKEIFVIERSHFDTVKVVLREYPQLDDEEKEIAHADPFLIAMALENMNKQKEMGSEWRPFIIVTDEAKKRHSPKKIPFVATQYRLECITLMEFFKREDWGV